VSEAAEAKGQHKARLPLLADPDLCGEDLSGNLLQMISVAPAACAGCSDYHIFNAAKRLSGHTPWSHGGRTGLTEMLGPLLRERAANDKEDIDIVIAACADTAVLSTCAYAVSCERGALLERTRFTVLDRCPSPLALCEAFASRHGLRLRTAVVDLLETADVSPADILILHNFLPFIAIEEHRPLLTRLGRWLKEGGRLLMWNTVLPPEDHDRIALRWKEQIAGVKSLVEDGTIGINEPKEVFFARLDRNVLDPRPGMPGCADVDTVRALVNASGLKIDVVEKIARTPGRGTAYIKVLAARDHL
jgi:hypothetical protein